MCVCGAGGGGNEQLVQEGLSLLVTSHRDKDEGEVNDGGGIVGERG